MIIIDSKRKKFFCSFYQYHWDWRQSRCHLEYHSRIPQWVWESWHPWSCCLRHIWSSSSEIQEWIMVKVKFTFKEYIYCRYTGALLILTSRICPQQTGKSSCSSGSWKQHQCAAGQREGRGLTASWDSLSPVRLLCKPTSHFLCGQST